MPLILDTVLCKTNLRGLGFAQNSRHALPNSRIVVDFKSWTVRRTSGVDKRGTRPIFMSLGLEN